MSDENSNESLENERDHWKQRAEDLSAQADDLQQQLERQQILLDFLQGAMSKVDDAIRDLQAQRNMHRGMAEIWQIVADHFQVKSKTQEIIINRLRNSRWN